MSEPLKIPWTGVPPEGELLPFIEQVQLRYERRLLARAYRIAGDWQIAEDAVQEAMIALFLALSEGRDVEDVAAWLGGSMCNLISTSGRKSTARCEAEEAAGNLREVVIETDELSILVEDLRESMRLLSPEQLEVLRMRYADERSFEQIAWRLGCDLSTVRNRHGRAISELRAFFHDHGPSQGGGGNP